MKWVKQTIHYWCDDTRSKHCLGNGICAAILDTGISAHPDFSGRILDFQDFTSSTPSVSKVSGSQRRTGKGMYWFLLIHIIHLYSLHLLIFSLASASSKERMNEKFLQLSILSLYFL